MKTETHHARVADQCNVLKKYKPIPALGGWVNNMRTNHKAGKLAADCAKLLESAGFVWCPRRDCGSSSLQCPVVSLSSAHDACDAAMCPSTTGMEVMNLNALD